MATVYFDTMVIYNAKLYKAKEYIEVKDNEVEQLKQEGAHVVGEPKPKPKVDVTTLVTMKVDELVKFAEANDIDLGNATKKADIFNTIVAALELK